MKHLYLILLSLPLYFSCNKSGSTNNSNSSLLVSVTEYQPGAISTKTVRNFSYDQNQQLGAVHTHTYDTSGAQVYLDSSLITYPSSSATTPPASYDIVWMIGTTIPASGATEHHLLYYDTQDRIVKDSITSKTNISNTSPNLFTTKFIYTNSTIIAQLVYPDPNNPGFSLMNALDTFTLLNGSLINNAQYTVAPGDTILISNDAYLFSTFKNPLYEASLSNRLGAVLRFNNIGDFISPYLMRQWTSKMGTSIPATRNYDWVTDSIGRVVQGFGTDIQTGLVTDYWTFQY
jgi:hypothetical protein